MSTVVIVFCTVCSTDFGFSMISSLSLIGGLDVRFLL